MMTADRLTKVVLQISYN